jgi:hypothetical protein
MNINLSGDYSLEDLKDYAEHLEDELEKIPQINKVDIKGLSEKEVRVEIDNFALEARQLNFNDIADALRSQNTTVSAGDIRLGDMNRSVKVSGEFKNMQDIENVIIKNEGQDIVYLRDVATVTFAEKEKESYAREFKSPVVSLDVIKRGGENLLEASDAIKAANGGKRVNLILEMVGGKTFDDSLEILAPFGRLVTYGMASRVAPSMIQPATLMGGSKTITGFWLSHCFGKKELMNDVIEQLFALVVEGKLKPVIGATYPMSQAVVAHKAMRSRETTGKITLDPKG